MRISRNKFLKTLGVTATATLAGATGFPLQAQKKDETKIETSLRLGLASYTLRKFTLDEVIEISKRLAFPYVALKSMHMPLDSSPAEIQSMAAKVRDAGLSLYGAGVIYMKTEAEVENAFNYASNAGLEIIIGVPNHELLPLVEQKVKDTNIKVAIHNHGPGDDLYSSPTDVHARIKDLDERIGFCIDVGHVVRIGEDPIPMIQKYRDRLFDMHMKDMDQANPKGKAVEMGRGIIDIPKIVKTLKKINYQGYVGFEYEKDANNPVPGLAESVGYMRGVMATV